MLDARIRIQHGLDGLISARCAHVKGWIVTSDVNITKLVCVQQIAAGVFHDRGVQGERLSSRSLVGIAFEECTYTADDNAGTRGFFSIVESRSCAAINREKGHKRRLGHDSVGVTIRDVRARSHNGQSGHRAGDVLAVEV